jgi:hypothetical protein
MPNLIYPSSKKAVSFLLELFTERFLGNLHHFKPEDEFLFNLA